MYPATCCHFSPYPASCGAPAYIVIAPVQYALRHLWRSPRQPPYNTLRAPSTSRYPWPIGTGLRVFFDIYALAELREWAFSEIRKEREGRGRLVTPAVMCSRLRPANYTTACSRLYGKCLRHNP